jgi:DNA repair exonuclease SbcCD ATPase subunit
MDQKQLEKKVSWLEKQRQKDAETIARLKEKLDGSEAESKNFARQLKELTSELARIGAAGKKMTDLEKALTKHRQDVSKMIEKDATARARREKDRTDELKSEMDELANVIVEMREGLRELKSIRGTIEARKEEEIRIARLANEVEKRIEGQVIFDEKKALVLASLEEGRKQDTKRLSEVDADTVDVRERMELLRASVESVEERLSRSEQQIGKAVAGESERRESQEIWIEQQIAKITDFERSWKSWSGRFDEFEKRAAEFDERNLSYSETHLTLRQLQTELEGSLERLERRIHEISEMQRLAEDRSKQEWTTFQADEQKRWNTHKLTSDERWREHMRGFEKLTADVRAISDNVKALMLGFDELKVIDRQRILELLGNLREWAADFEVGSGNK